MERAEALEGEEGHPKGCLFSLPVCTGYGGSMKMQDSHIASVVVCYIGNTEKEPIRKGGLHGALRLQLRVGKREVPALP